MSYSEVALQSNFWPILLFKFSLFFFFKFIFLNLELEIVFEIQFTEEP